MLYDTFRGDKSTLIDLGNEYSNIIFKSNDLFSENNGLLLKTILPRSLLLEEVKNYFTGHHEVMQKLILYCK